MTLHSIFLDFTPVMTSPPTIIPIFFSCFQHSPPHTLYFCSLEFYLAINLILWNALSPEYYWNDLTILPLPPWFFLPSLCLIPFIYHLTTFLVNSLKRVLALFKGISCQWEAAGMVRSMIFSECWWSVLKGLDLEIEHRMEVGGGGPDHSIWISRVATGGEREYGPLLKC